jgi:multidrug efflux pump subunit AcrA (membrane-fusion protein)
MRAPRLVRLALVATTFAACAGIGLSAAPVAGAEAPPTGGAIVRVVRAVRECFSDTISATGFLVARQEAMVILDDRSRVTEVLAREGDQVKAGQILARAVREDMPGGPAQPPAPSQPARPATSSAASPSTVALRSPATGLIAFSSARVGAVMSSRGEPLFRIIIDSQLELEVEVPSIHVPKLKVGETARLTIDDGRDQTGGEDRTVLGRVRLVPAEIDRMTQLGRARLAIPQNPALRVGMFAQARIDASQSCGLSVPRNAVFHETGGTTVQVVRGRLIETRRVRVGLSSDTKTEINEGLKEGDAVVADAGTSFHDGDQVQAIFADESEN